MVEYDPTPTCATPSRFRCWSRAASQPGGEVAPRARRLGGQDGYEDRLEISFTRYLYEPQPLRSLEEIRADILALERETEGLLVQIVEAGVS